MRMDKPSILILVKIDIRVVTTTLTIYDSVMTATVTGGSVSLGRNMIATGDILIDWGDGTTTTRPSGVNYSSDHTYTDGLNEHTICFVGEITSLGRTCFYGCTGLTSVVIPNSVVSLGNYCFLGCTGLTSVTIPSNVTSLGDSCFYGCNALVDYQLYWKDTAIIEYNSDKIPVNSNTYFTIPQGQRTQYLAKNYPNKIKIRGYDLSLTTDKTIIEEDETSTTTATLTYNMEPISDETVSYTIRQGSTVIDTGSDTTDSNGEIEIEYTGTSAGKITIQVTYDDLTETTIIYDTIKYDKATTTDHNDNFWASTTNITRNTNYSTIGSTNAISIYTQITGDMCIEFDVRTNADNKAIVSRISNNGTFLYDLRKNRLGVGDDWKHIRLTIIDNLLSVDGTSITDVSVTDFNRFYFRIAENKLLDFKDIMVYSIGGSSKVDTSISIGSDKASYYTDESILLSGTLVDDDNQPLVSKSVKVYRGASLIDTVSTDSTGTYEKTVTGLSAGSYSFKAVYDGDEVYQGSTSSSLSVIVQNHTYSLSISSDKQIILTTESVKITGTLLKDSTAFSSQSVDLYDGVTKIATLTTDSDGEYEETVSNLSVGVHTFKAVNSNAESSTISITVNEPTHTYSLSIASDKSSILTTESVIISGQLLKDSSPYTGQSVALYDGSSLVDTLTTDSDGEYEKTLTGLSVGTHSFKAVNSNAESSTVTVTVTEPSHDYSLSVASTKDILSYADSESATITATLTDNSVAVAGETLSYVIKHGSTTISTGSDTTDSNGQISFNYSATGVGDVTIEVDYGILLQERYEIEDCYKTYMQEYTSASNVNYDLPSKFLIEFTLWSNSVGGYGGSAFLRFNNSSGAYVGKGSSNNRNITINTTVLNQLPVSEYKTFYLSFEDGVATLTDGTDSITSSLTLTKLYQINSGGSNGKIKNVKIKAL